MLNQVVLVGRLKETPTIKENENGKKIVNITLSVPRSFKNANGEYDTDFIPCILWNGVAETTSEYCKAGDLLGIKGRIQTRKNKIEVVAEKVTYLAAKKEEK